MFRRSSGLIATLPSSPFSLRGAAPIGVTDCTDEVRRRAGDGGALVSGCRAAGFGPPCPSRREAGAGRGPLPGSARRPPGKPIRAVQGAGVGSADLPRDRLIDTRPARTSGRGREGRKQVEIEAIKYRLTPRNVRPITESPPGVQDRIASGAAGLRQERTLLGSR